MPIDIETFEEESEFDDAEPLRLQILRYLARHDDKAFTRSEIADALDTDPNSVSAILSRLKEQRLVRHKPPYWALGEICLGPPLEGHHELDMNLAADDADPEVWHVRLNYSQGGLAPRPSDPVDSDSLYEFRLHLEGPGEAKADFHIRPRFDDMTKASDGESASIPWCGGEGIDVHVQGSNLELDEYQYLLQKALQEVAEAAGTDFSRRYFNHVRSDSRIVTFERYVRLLREYGEKLTRADGVFLRLMHLAADLDDAEWVYSGHNENGIPKRHAFDVDPTTAAELVAVHSLGKRLKC
jgi:hypothetical protein